MKYILAIFSFLFVFACIFFVCGFFLMPYLPPRPSQPISVFDGAYWVDNWPGYILGTIVGFLSARSSLKSSDKKRS